MSIENLETYGEEENFKNKDKILKKKGFFAKIGEYLRQRVEQKQEQKAKDEALLSEVRLEARKQALNELKPELVRKYKEDELNRLTGQKKGKFVEGLQKLGKEFKESNIGSSDKIREMLGKSSQQNSFQNQNKDVGVSNQRIAEMMSFSPNRKTQQNIVEDNKEYDFDAKMRKALGK